jgi:hypothetical protein
VLGAGAGRIENVTFTPTDSADYTTASTSVTVNVAQATLTVTADNQSKVYGAADPTLTYTPSGTLYNGDSYSVISGVMLSTTTGAAAVAGTHTITAAGGTAVNYSITFVNGTLTVSQAALTVTADNQGKVYGAADPSLTYTPGGTLYYDDTYSVISGVTLSTTTGAAATPGTHAIFATGGTAANYAITDVNGTLSVTAAPLSATGLNFDATAGTPFQGAVATFTNADPYGSNASYSATITWGDGGTSAGVITDLGGGTYQVSGTHTYAAAGNESVSVQISHNLGYTTTATTSSTATVTSQGGTGVQSGQTAGIGFWHNKNGQALINSFNGGGKSAALATWLAATFPNLYGSGSTNNLTGKSNAQVAAFYQSLFALSGPRVDAEVLATALNVYATTTSLGGNAGAAYGFKVSAPGLGAATFNVGADGAAVGVANNSTLTVSAMLAAVNQRAVNGVLYNGDSTLRSQATDLFDALNNAGSIGGQQ